MCVARLRERQLEPVVPERRALAERRRRRRGQGAARRQRARTTSTASRARPGLLTPGVEYTFTMQVRLEAPGTADVRFVVKPSFTWVGNATVNGSSWTTLTGTFTPPAGADPSTLQVYIGSGPHSGGAGAYAYLVDDLRDHLGRPDRARRRESSWRRTSSPGSTAGCRAATRRETRPSRDGRRGARRHAGGAGLRSHLAGRRHRARRHRGSWSPASPYQISAWVKFAAGQGNGRDLAEHAARQRRRVVVRHGRADARRHRRRVEPGLGEVPDGERGHGLPLLRDDAGPTERPRASSSTTSS